MTCCHPSRTPIETSSKLGTSSPPVANPTLYRSLAGALQYLTFTRPDIAFAGTLDHGLQLYTSSTPALTTYSDADWAGCPSTRRSTSGYCVFLGMPFTCQVPVQHQRTKHEIDIHFVRDLVIKGHVRVLHVNSRYQYADIFTKGLPAVLFDEFRSSLSVRPTPAPTAGGC
ncbi:uncharacterized mitochondrial protein AtMg00810-like [Rutidosis leptorrhynchoides]|uniref:uncharacterized mitochondrial protein AtMg00810-like n=1 Tax=Rutidosis leptorrhynchoides TaxID=125765 RepID=UPI003A9A60D9